MVQDTGFSIVMHLFHGNSTAACLFEETVVLGGVWVMRVRGWLLRDLMV
jgi:hypothetical protein